MAIQDCFAKNIPERFQLHTELFQWIKENYLVANRIDQIWTFLAEERHVVKVGKDKYQIGSSFDFDGLPVQIEKFHRKSQRKRLSKKYDV